MSKSLGNVIDPIELIDEFGADAVRFTLTSMAAMGRDLKLSTGRVAGYRNFGTKLWNAARFAEMNGCRPDPDFDPRTPREPLNRWIVGETARVREAVDAALDDFRFNDAASVLYNHVWARVCDWYVEFSKPLFQGADAAAAAETRATMAWVIDQCLVLLHPIMPFITEQLWGDLAERGKMLAHADWPEYASADIADDAADRSMAWVIGLVEQVRSVRSELRVPAGATVPMNWLELDSAGLDALANNHAMIRRLARVGDVAQADRAPEGAVTLPVDGGVFFLELEGLVDVAAERERLSKARHRLDGEMTKIRSRLANASFTAKAPEHVIDEQHARLEAAVAELAKLKAAIDRIQVG